MQFFKYSWQPPALWSTNLSILQPITDVVVRIANARDRDRNDNSKSDSRSV